MIKKVMKKQKLKNKVLAISMVAVLSISSFIGFVNSPLANADRFDQQIAELRADNEDNQAEIADLELGAQDLQATVTKLQNRVVELQTKINKNEAKRDQIKKEIVAAEAELVRKKALLGENIRAIYLEGEITTLEMLASSEDLSEFLDKEEYRNSIQDQIKIMLDRINELKANLIQQKKNIENLIKEDTSLKSEIAEQKAQQTYLLNLNQQEQYEFNSQIANNQEKIEELRQEQIISNLALFGGGVQPGIPGGGGYSWGNAYCVHTGSADGACWNYDWYFNGGAWDSWGYGFRNCTSWVGYKLAMDGKEGISNLGNANQWPGRAAARGYDVKYGSGAKAGDAAVNTAGYYGHVMYVEAVTDDGRVVVSDYNRTGDGYYRGPDTGNAGVLDQSSLVFISF
jgi:surface antigen